MSSTTQLLTQKIVGSESSTPPQSLTLQQEYLLKRQSNFISTGQSTRLLDTSVFFQKTDGTNYQGSECQDSNFLDLLNGDFSELFGECRIKTFAFKVSNFDGTKALNFSLKVNGKSVLPTNGIITGTYGIGAGARLGETGTLYIPQVGDGSFTTEIGTATAGTVNQLEIVVNIENQVKLFHNP